jgi:hypothetical protein
VHPAYRTVVPGQAQQQQPRTRTKQKPNQPKLDLTPFLTKNLDIQSYTTHIQLI